MYLDGESKVLSIGINVSTITNMKIFIIKLGNQIIHQVPNYLIRSTWDVGPPPRLIYLLHKLTLEDSIFIRVIELIMLL